MLFQVYAIYFYETVHKKWRLHESVRQTENGLECGFVKKKKPLDKLHLNDWPKRSLFF